MSDQAYNGWKNYPTWAVNLWLSNDEALYESTNSRAHMIQRTPNHPDQLSMEYRMAEELRTWVTDDLAPDLGASFAADLLGYALGEVDWHEIAAAWLSEVEAA